MASLPYAGNQSNPYEKIRSDYNKIARMQFPQDMGRYYIAFDFAEYSAGASSGAGGMLALPGAQTLANAITTTINGIFSSFGANVSVNGAKMQGVTYGIGNINATIALPMPPNLVDDQQLDYNAQNLLNIAAAGVSGALSSAAGAAGKGSMIGDLNNAASAVSSKLNDFQSVFTGKTVNPFLAMMFNGPRFKTHQFGWRFSPKTPEETTEIMKIVNTFKAKALPASSGLVFTYPDVVLISLYPETSRNLMYKFKPAVITEVQVHYAPSGTPSFFAGTNGPAEIELKIQLSEISIWTKADIPDYSSTDVTGYGR